MKFKTKEEIKKYWEDRSETQGDRTVGFNYKSMNEQNTNYEIRKEFIFKSYHVDRSKYTLDYGCGIGRYSNEFDLYHGVDVTKKLLDIAKHTYTDKVYTLLDDPILPHDFKINNFAQFFTATVLQHNPDNIVQDIFNNIYKINHQKSLTFCLYENSQIDIGHVKGRKPKEYIDMIAVKHNIIYTYSDNHIIHGQEHSLTIVEVSNEN